LFRVTHKGLPIKAQKQVVDDLVTYIDSIIEKLDIDSNGNPLKLLGLKATFGLIKSIYTGLFTIAFAVFRQQVN
jgi:hypothetical protein